MSANSPQQNPHHHDTAPPTDSGPAATIPPAGDATLTTTSVAHSDRITSAAEAAAAAAAQHHPYTHDAAGDAETLSYPPPDPSSQQTLLPPANFTPFFTLVEDAATAEHHHPRVHYVFSDDDPDLHTAVFMRALGDTTSLHASPAATLKHPHHFLQHADDEDHNNGQHADALLLPPPAPGVKERFVVLDLGADGHTVAGATSLSREWQVVGTAVAPAPSFAEDGADDPSGAGGALMLRVEGTEIRPARPAGAAAGLDVDQREEEAISAALAEAKRAADGELVAGMEELLRRFDSGIDMLRKVVGADVEVVVAAEAEAEREAEDGAAV
ncbi:hypothetical protein GTA08_BOTSDO10068 [Neofusicoccum parvum]|uniref:Uncharacterized protein n=1 Tax=Neofusicoccum parvum TaxID=310453 RepID=A0ACB5S312_9PEZI|nr:hypothetical protein GTA08_BOTSDO10068 [Neofusicoccum parvum]